MIITLIIILIPCILIRNRNNKVYAFRSALLNELYNLHGEKETFTKAINIFESVSYEAMVFKIWIPLDTVESWYPDEQCLFMRGRR